MLITLVVLGRMPKGSLASIDWLFLQDISPLVELTAVFTSLVSPPARFALGLFCSHPNGKEVFSFCWKSQERLFSLFMSSESFHPCGFDLFPSSSFGLVALRRVECCLSWLILF